MPAPGASGFSTPVKTFWYRRRSLPPVLRRQNVSVGSLHICQARRAKDHSPRRDQNFAHVFAERPLARASEQNRDRQGAALAIHNGYQWNAVLSLARTAKDHSPRRDQNFAHGFAERPLARASKQNRDRQGAALAIHNGYQWNAVLRLAQSSKDHSPRRDQNFAHGFAERPLARASEHNRDRQGAALAIHNGYQWNAVLSLARRAKDHSPRREPCG